MYIWRSGYRRILQVHKYSLLFPTTETYLSSYSTLPWRFLLHLYNVLLQTRSYVQPRTIRIVDRNQFVFVQIVLPLLRPTELIS
ncbi:hypothetical protein M378DRAFT_542039 [Amanita muscaria Koide BX008]|uniref:Uncharacterized protein n=1 Tax=Amanita muscaria (strain Koide BX008) TaxID=946122 RepID=A0A0C2X723_AMAMK|nr:hypothetical protein M378DRAFT_542039 [Amanita muscaria Koide BX008]